MSHTATIHLLKLYVIIGSDGCAEMSYPPYDSSFLIGQLVLNVPVERVS